MNSSTTKHTVTMTDRTIISITSVEEVVSFDDTMVTLSIGDKLLNVSGSDLTVTKLSLQEGEVVISGMIDAVVYFEQNTKKKFLLGRFIK